MWSLWSAHLSHPFTNVQSSPQSLHLPVSQEDRSSAFGALLYSLEDQKHIFLPSPRCILQHKRSSSTKTCHPAVTNASSTAGGPHNDKDIQPNWDSSASGGWKCVYIIKAIMFFGLQLEVKTCRFLSSRSQVGIAELLHIPSGQNDCHRKVEENIFSLFELSKTVFVFRASAPFKYLK